MNENNQRKYGVILSYLAIIVNTVIQLLYTPILIRMLGQSEYGLYSLVSSIIGYLTVLDLGFGNAIIVYTAKYRTLKQFDKEKKLHGMFKLIYFIIALIVSIIGVVLYFNVDNIFANSMSIFELKKMKILILILIFNLFLTFVFSIYSSIISANEKFIYQKIIAIISAILKPCLMLPLLFFGFKSIALTIIITLVNIFVLFSNYYYVKKKLDCTVKFNGFDKKLFKEIFAYSFFIFLCNIVDQINHNVDQSILGIMSGTNAVSIYSVAMQINLMFIQLSSAVNSLFLPKITKMVSNKATNKELTDEFIKVGRLQFYIIFLICSGFILVGKEFMILWAGPNYIDSYYIVLLLIIPASIPLIQNIGLSIMQAMNKYKFKAITTLIMSILNVIISIYLVSKFGAIGAALGTCISLVVCNIILINIYYYKSIKIDIFRYWKEIIQMLLKVLVPLLISIIIVKISNFTGLFSIITYSSIYIVLYSLTVYFFVLNNNEKNLVNTVFKKIIK